MVHNWRASRRAVPPRRLAAGLLGAAAVLLCSHAPRAAHAPILHVVVIEGVKFTPDALTVNRGDWVHWINKDPFPHTVTAPGTFDSHSIAVGATWKYRARKAGNFAYTCTLHPNMKGTLRVEK